MLELIRELAVYEKAPDEVTVDPLHFEESGFGLNPVWWAFVVENQEKKVVAFALYYIRYSTWKGQVMYLEDISDGQRYLELAQRITRRADKPKPILAIKTGRSPEGAAAAASHTGSLAGPPAPRPCALRGVDDAWPGHAGRSREKAQSTLAVDLAGIKVSARAR